MADDNKPIKYMRYAIGEIVLVVIGILIALQINTWNEQNKSDAKIDVLFEKVLDELALNITESKWVIKNSKLRDSLSYLVLNNKLTYDDYVNPELHKNGNLVIYYLASGSTFFTDVLLKTSAYDNLLLNMDAIPAKYDNVVGELDIMYVYDKRYIDLADQEMIDFVYEIETERRLKYEWYNTNERPNEGMIDYMLNNYLYKNEIQRHRALNDNQVNSTLQYRISAIRIYQELAALLNKPALHDSFKVNPEVVKLLTGTFNFIGSSNSEENNQQYLEVLKFEDNHIVTYQPRDSTIAWENTVVDFKKTETRAFVSMLRNSGAVYMDYIVEGDTLTIQNRNGTYWKFLKVK